jgi:hypothetical protein
LRSPEGRRVTVRQLADAAAELPAVSALKPDELPDPDLLICVLGFEERCSAVPAALAAADRRIGAAIICRYPTNPADNEANETRLRACLDALEPRTTHELEVSADLPGGLRAALASIRDGLGTPRVSLDISVASNALIIRALRTLLDDDVVLAVLYAEAEVYRPARDEYNKRTGQLARGVLDVGVTNEFPGRHDVALPHRVVVFPGFDRDRVRAAISEINNDFIVEVPRAPVTWMIGRPLHYEDAWRQQALVTLHEVPPVHDQRVVSTFDYRDAMSALEEVHRRFGLHANISVVPLGSKMQAVGLTLFCLARPEVAVVVSQPREYSAVAYSRGARALWHVPLGSARMVTQALASVDTVTMEPLNGADAPIAT